jgi:hypothetical protein
VGCWHLFHQFEDARRVSEVRFSGRNFAEDEALSHILHNRSKVTNRVIAHKAVLTAASDCFGVNRIFSTKKDIENRLRNRFQRL